MDAVPFSPHLPPDDARCAWASATTSSPAEDAKIETIEVAGK